MIDDAAREIAILFVADGWHCERVRSILSKHFGGPRTYGDVTGTTPGIERPDAPGVWFNGKACVDVSYDAYGTRLWFQCFGDEDDYQIEELPPGNWRRAVPLPPAPGA